jgi:hypothetical protein
MEWDAVWLGAPAAVGGGIALVIGPVRRAWQDGWRCLARHPCLWQIPAVFSLRSVQIAGSALNALALVFEFLFGTVVKIFLLLTAFGWAAGRHFSPERLGNFAVRRLGFVLKWSLILITLTLVLIHLPLLLETLDVAGAAWLAPSLAATVWEAGFPALSGAAGGWVLAGWVALYAAGTERLRAWNV